MLLLLFDALASLIAGRVAAGWVFSDEETPDRLTLWLLWSISFFLLTPLAIGTIAGSLTVKSLYVGFSILTVAAIIAHIAIGRRLTSWKYDKVGLGDSILLAWGREILGASWKARFAWAIVVLWVLGMSAPGWFLTPRTWDAVECYMLQPVDYLPPHEFSLSLPLPGGPEQYRTLGETFPNLKGFWAIQVMLGRDSMKGAGLAQVPFLFIALVALWGIGRRLELPAWTTAVGAFFLISMPEVMLQSTELYTDVQTSSTLLIVLWALTGLDREAFPRRWIVVAGLAFGHLAAAKASLLITGGLLGLLAVGLAMHRAGKGKRIQFGALMLASGLIGGVVLAGPWLLRGAIVYHNPIYPISVSVGDHMILPGTGPASLNTGVLMSQTGLTESQAYLNSALEGGGITHLGFIAGGWGPQGLVFGLPALILLAVLGFRRNATRWRLILAVVALVILGSPDLWWPRFGLQVLIFATVGVAAWMALADRWQRILLMMLLIVFAGWNGLRVVPSILFRCYEPIILAYPFITGDPIPLLEEHRPDEFAARDFAREIAGSDPGVRMAYIGDATYRMPPIRLIPDEMRNPLVPTGRIEDTDGPEAWMADLLDSEATHIILPFGRPEGRLLDEHPEHFQSLYRDRPWRAEHPWGPSQYPREAVWAIQREGADE
ncbi:hypothetical protein KQI84_12210 [bacterium]|nr:hypothetical protein [bacterium]